jgi:EF-hand domain pair
LPIQDIDGTEKIRYTEFLAATIEAQGALGDDKLAEAFDRLDSDGTGYITADNLAEMLGNEITRQEIDAIVAESAISNDGRISFEAFMRLWEDPHDEPNHYEIFRDIMIGDGKMDSERSANLSGISSDDDLPIRPHATIGEQDVSKQSVSSSENRKRVSFNAPEM